MKKIVSILAFTFALSAQAQKIEKPTVVDASCGECKFGMAGKGCDLAVRIEGKTYFVDGTSLDSHGDAHAEDGFCSAIRKAEVTGEVVGDRFKATTFKLLPQKAVGKK